MSRRTRKFARKIKADKYGAYYAMVLVALCASAFFVFDKYLYQIDWESLTSRQKSSDSPVKKTRANKNELQTTVNLDDPKLGDKITNADLSILFIGNGDTTKENFPQLLKYMIQSTDPEMRILIESHTAARMDLEQLANYEETRELIALGEWDFVVLQGENSRSTYDAMRKISGWKEAQKTQIVLFSMWTPQTLSSMTHEIHRQYINTARVIDADVVPAGMAWMESQISDPETKLYYDFRHADFAGAYLTACVFYCYFTKLDVSQMKSVNLFELENRELSEDTRQRLKQAAWNAYNSHKFLHQEFGLTQSARTGR